MITNQYIINSLNLYLENSDNDFIKKITGDLLNNLDDEKTFKKLLIYYIKYLEKEVNKSALDSNGNTIPNKKHSLLDVLKNIKRILDMN